MPPEATLVLAAVAWITLVLASVSCLRTALSRSGLDRLVWGGTAVGTGLLLVAFALWATMSLTGPGALVGDLSYLVGALVMAGSLALPVARHRRSPSGRRAILDGAVVLACLVLLFVMLVDESTLLHGPAGGFSAAVVSADALLLLVAYALVVVEPGRLRADSLLLATAFALWLAGDAVAYSDIAGPPSLSKPVAIVLSVAGAVVLVAAARVGDRAEPRLWRPEATWLPTLLAALPEVVLVGVAWTVLLIRPQTWVEWAAAVLAGTLSAVRQLVQALDARRTRAAMESEMRDQAEEVRHLSDTRSRLLDAVEEAIVGLGPEGRVTFVNPGARRLIGWLDDDVVEGRSVCDVLCVEPHAVCPLRLVVELGAPLHRVESVFLRADGSSVPVELNASPMVGGAVLAFHDISEQRVVEQHKQQFVSSVSHELRTPLASIRGVLELLGDGDAGPLSAPALRLVASAERGTERLTRLVADIIDLEKIASGDFTVVPVAQPIGPVVAHAVASLEPLAGQACVDVRLVSPPETIVLCDADRIEQAVVNLIGNAVKFSDRGGVVEVEVRALAAEVEVMVRDHGRGIPVADLDHVFDRFRQVRATDATEKGGTGLGLTITRSIVERHGGRIRVESEEGDGATFTFTLQRESTPPSPRLVQGSDRALA